MRKTILLFILFLSISSLNAQSIVFTNVNIIPMDNERVLENQTLLINDGIILKYGNYSEIEIPKHTRIIDGKGQYLLPGLSDMHVHLRNSEELINYLAYGVTTIMHMGASRSFGKRNLNFRREIANGKLIGPYIYTTGRVFDGDPPASGGAYRIATPQLAKELVLELKNDGFDFIKVYNNITASVFSTIIEEGKLHNLPVVGHLSRKMDPLDVINGGQNLIAHTEELFFTYFKGPRSTNNINKNYRPDYSLIPNLVEALKRNKTAIIPNLNYAYSDFVMWDDLENLFSDPEIKYISPQIIRNEFHLGNINRRDNIENFIYRDQIKYTLTQELTRQFQEAGVLQLLGTDATQAGIFPGKSVHRELRELIKAGLTNFEALSIATKNAGVFIAENNLKGGDFGQIKAGYRADMVMLKKNPLEDIRHLKLISGVVAQGKWLEKDYLSSLREDIAIKYQELGEVENKLKESLASNSIELELSQLVKKYGTNKVLLKSIESNINSMGYNALSNKNFENALHLFGLNTKFFPQSANAWDSYAEGFLKKGDKINAIKFYKKVLEVDQTSDNAKIQLKKLIGD